MKYILSLSLLSVVFALPAPQGVPDPADHAYDKFEFRVGHINNNGDKAYAAWVAGESSCNQRNRIGEGITSWCENGGRWTTVPYPEAPNGQIEIKLICDPADTEYGHVTYQLKSGKDGSCTKADENFPKCPEVRTVLNCVPNP
ncbi:hypothetical protein DIS24_g9646 [Lasiodiplodia hormozganensis]|uniref:Uncharacterized protein n=1 Tax=Lasiodiplodia hormozganensis TaxID=869390 RepID=A0AA40CJ02_9PEZI|nr:hypothetical protein DIS24_g9646 [Lasiodiplodia hormozganensis]